MNFFSLGFKFTNWFETSVHDIFRKKIVKSYSIGQLNDAKANFTEWNLHANGIYHSQLTTGPLFGEYSDYFAERAKELMKRRKL